MTAVEKS